MKIIEWIAKTIGWSTNYHVACKCAVDSSSTATGAGIYNVKPWLTPENYKWLREAVSEGHGFDVEQTVISSITKL